MACGTQGRTKENIHEGPGEKMSTINMQLQWFLRNLLSPCQVNIFIYLSYWCHRFEVVKGILGAI